MWRKLEADGCEWEVRSVSRTEEEDPSVHGEILEFRPLDHLRPPRQLAVGPGALAGMDEAALRAAFRKARPVGGDYYGRPGKRMSDSRE